MGLRQIAFVVGTVALTIGCSQPNPAENNPNYKARSGKKIYTETCISCHGKDGRLCSAGAKDLSVSRKDSVNIVDIIKNGKNGMPRQSHRIYNEEEYSNIVEYVKALRR